MKHLRFVADKIAGLTDSSAVKLHKQFFPDKSCGQTLYFGVNGVRLNRTVSRGKVHYVVQRGHNGSDIFFDDKDRETYLTVVFQGGVRYKAVIHAFQLLQHEAHWLFTPHEENSIALTVQSVGREYVRYFNQRWGGLGHSGMVDINLIGWTKILFRVKRTKIFRSIIKNEWLNQ